MKLSKLPSMVFNQFLYVVRRQLVIAPARSPRPSLPEGFTVEEITPEHVAKALRAGRLDPVKAKRFTQSFLKVGKNRGAVILDPDGIPAAWCFMSPRKAPEPFWYKHDTFTVPQFRCRGLGFYLNALMVNEFSGGIPVVCIVRRNNRPAMRNWEKMNASIVADATRVRFLRLWFRQTCHMRGNDAFADHVATALRLKK